MILLLLGCLDTVALDGDFSGPDGAAILDADRGPFAEPVAFVANQRRGTIVPLDLKHGWILAEDPSASFIEAPHIATGAERVLGSLAVWAPDTQTTTLYVADAFTGTLLEVPYVLASSDAGVETVRPTLVADPVASGAAKVSKLELRRGRAASEDWTLTYTNGAWRVEGSRSGLQSRHARFLEPFQSDDGSIDLLLDGQAEQGDTITFSVDTGVVEHDVGGVVEDLLALPDAGLILASVLDLDTEVAALVAFDPEASALAGEIPLPVGARPWRMSAARSGDVLYVADSRAAVVYEVLLDTADVANSTVRSIPVETPAVDIAWQAGDGYEHLFVAEYGSASVRIYDVLADAWFDVNPATPEVDGIYTETHVIGLGPSADPVRLQYASDWGARPQDHVVAMTTYEGVVLIAEGATGCLILDQDGPYVTTGDASLFDDVAPESNPSMSTAGSTGTSIQVSTCGGISKNETWAVTFDQSQGNWVVQGAVSGKQVGRAWEDERYVSDGGEISFLIRAGTLPTSSGDQFGFSVVAGFVEISGDRNNSGVADLGDVTLEALARPVPYSFLAGSVDGGWVAVNRKVGVVVPNTNGNNVLRVDLNAAQIDTVWD
jgi:hypothetical protein